MQDHQIPRFKVKGLFIAPGGACANPAVADRQAFDLAIADPQGGDIAQSGIAQHHLRLRDMHKGRHRAALADQFLGHLTHHGARLAVEATGGGDGLCHLQRCGCGLGAMAQAIANQNISGFWRLPQQIVVAAFLFVRVTDPQAHGLDPMGRAGGAVFGKAANDGGAHLGPAEDVEFIRQTADRAKAQPGGIATAHAVLEHVIHIADAGAPVGKDHHDLVALPLGRGIDQGAAFLGVAQDVGRGFGGDDGQFVGPVFRPIVLGGQTPCGAADHGDGALVLNFDPLFHRFTLIITLVPPPTAVRISNFLASRCAPPKPRPRPPPEV